MTRWPRSCAPKLPQRKSKWSPRRIVRRDFSLLPAFASPIRIGMRPKFKPKSSGESAVEHDERSAAFAISAVEDVPRLHYQRPGRLDAIQAIDLLHAIGYRGIGFTLDHGLLNPFADDFHEQLDQTAERLTSLRHAFRHRNRRPLPARPTSKARADARHGRLRRPSPPRRFSLPGRRCRRRPRLRLRLLLVRHRPRRGRGPRSDGSPGRRPRSKSSTMPAKGRRPRVRARAGHVHRHDGPLRRSARSARPTGGRSPTSSGSRSTSATSIARASCRSPTSSANGPIGWSNVHIEDMRAGVHEHLMFGEGEIDFPPVIEALAEIDYSGIIAVELSRHAHVGAQAARQAYNFLRPLCDAARGA